MPVSKGPGGSTLKTLQRDGVVLLKMDPAIKARITELIRYSAAACAAQSRRAMSAISSRMTLIIYPAGVSPCIMRSRTSRVSLFGVPLFHGREAPNEGGGGAPRALSNEGG
jgi:hypothetical protein